MAVPATYIIVHHCPVVWQNTPIGHLQALPRSGEAITKSRNRDATFEEVVLDIQKVAQSLRNTLGQEAQRAEKISEPAELQIVQMAQLTDAPDIATQRDWKAWVATFDDVSVSYAHPNPSMDYAYVATGTNKKELGTFHYTSRHNVVHLCKMLVEVYGRQDAVSSSEWVVKEVFPFLH